MISGKRALNGCERDGSGSALLGFLVDIHRARPSDEVMNHSHESPSEVPEFSADLKALRPQTSFPMWLDFAT